MKRIRSVVAIVMALVQLTVPTMADAQLQLPWGGGGFQLPKIQNLNLPHLFSSGPSSSGQLQGAAKQLALQAAYTALGNAIGDALPIDLDASTAYPAVDTPADFNPALIDCTPDNMQMQLPPGDYTCQVRLYCMRDSVHRPSYGIPYDIAPLEGKQAEAIGTLFVRGTYADISPETLQTISWEIQASIPLNEMPPEHQQIIQQLIPEYAQSLQGDFLEQIEGTYTRYANVPGLPPLETMLGQMGQPGQIVLSAQRDQNTIRANSLNYERLNEEVYNPGRYLAPPAGEASTWSEITPGVIAQLVIEQGNLGLNTLNFRVLPAATQTGSNAVTGKFAQAAFVPGEQQKMAMTAVEIGPLIYLFTIFGIAIAGKQIKAGKINIGYSVAANAASASQSLTIMPNDNGSSPCNTIENQLSQLIGTLKGRYNRMIIDKYSLYELAYSSNPGGELVGKGYWLGHVEIYYAFQKGLNNEILKAKENNCSIPSYAYDWAKQPAPNAPGKITGEKPIS